MLHRDEATVRQVVSDEPIAMTKIGKSGRKGQGTVARSAATGKFVTEKVARTGRTKVIEPVRPASRDAIEKGSKRFSKALESLAKR
jgi:hypothetical protein